MTKTISFIHAADLHLDSPFRGLTTIPEYIFQEVRDSTFHAFDQLVDVAITKQVDFVLLVGDLFDNDKQSLKAQVYLRKGFQRLQQADIQVYLSYGNHDYVLGNPYRLAFPENVHVFPHETVTHLTYKKNNEELANIYGFSYHHRAVRQNKAEEYQMTREQIPYHIATLHGAIHGNQDHDPYAPFTLQQLQTTSFDYWALGHIHTRTVLSTNPPIIYSGNTQGRHRNETGDKGCYYVKMTPTDTHFEFTSLQSIAFIQMDLDMSDCQTLDDIEETLMSIAHDKEQKQLIYLTVTFDQQQWNIVHDEEVLVELIEIVNDTLLEGTAWQFIYDFQVTFRQEAGWAVEKAFVQQLDKAITEVNVDHVLADLYRHPIARRFLEHENEEEMKEEAKKVLQQSLLWIEDSDVT